MRRPVLALALCLALAGVARADEPPRTLTVEGSATVSAAPDVARVRLAVERRDPSLRKARETVVATSRNVLALCGRLGIPEAKVQSSGLSIQPEYRYDGKGGPPVLTGYVVQRQIAVEVTNLDKLGELLEGAADAGINQVFPPELDSSRRRELGRQALAGAAEDARANAGRIAESLGLKLGPLRTLTAGQQSPPRPMPMYAMKAMAAEASAPADTYTAGEISIDAQVTATFDVRVP